MPERGLWVGPERRTMGCLRGGLWRVPEGRMIGGP